MKEIGERMSNNIDSLLDTVVSELLVPNQLSLSILELSVPSCIRWTRECMAPIAATFDLIADVALRWVNFECQMRTASQAENLSLILDS